VSGNPIHHEVAASGKNLDLLKKEGYGLNNMDN
jgi:hypothetical protein